MKAPLSDASASWFETRKDPLLTMRLHTAVAGPDGRLQRLALQQPRHLARQTRRLADEHAFQRRSAIDQPQPDIAHRAQHLRFVREQQIQEQAASQR